MKNILKLTVLAALTLLSITSCKKEEINEPKKYNGIEYTGDLFRLEMVTYTGWSPSRPEYLQRTQVWSHFTNGKTLEIGYDYIMVAIDKYESVQLTSAISTCGWNANAQKFKILNVKTNDLIELNTISCHRNNSVTFINQ